MRKAITVLIVALLAMVLVIPAAAGGNGPGGKGPGNGTGTGQGQQGTRGTFAITGTVSSIDENTVTVEVIRGNHLVQPYLNTTVVLTLTPRTRFLFKDETTVTVIGLDDLEVGQPVSVNGIFTDNLWTTTRITVGASLSCLP
jgi:hypothetical protein